MSSLLTQFQSAFKSEHELRQALHTLICKMPGVMGAQITHGSQEYGKDHVFYAPDFLGRMQLHACVVKNSKIDGSAKSSGAREVLTQAFEALDTPHITPEGQEEMVSRVLIVSPYDCPPTTMRSIQGALKQRAGQVTFLCGTLLIEEFSKYWQEFLLYNSSALNLYVAAVSRSIMGHDPIHFLLRNHQLLTGELESLQSRYVSQGFKKAVSSTVCNIDRDFLTKRPFVSAIDLLEARTMTNALAGFALLLRADLSPSPEDWPAHMETSLALEEISGQILPAWQASYDEYQKEIERTGRKALPRSHAQVPIGVAVYERFKETLVMIDVHIKKLNAKIDAINRYIENPRNTNVKVASEIFKQINEVQDIVRAVPALFLVTGESKDLVVSTKEVLQSQGVNLLITAPAGYGKTSFCKIHAMRDALALENKKSERIPVYVSLHSLATTVVDDEMFLQLPEIRAVMESGEATHLQWTYYLDGLDEIADPNQRDQILRVAHRMLERFPQAKLVITSRDYIRGTFLYWLTRVDLAELDDVGVQDIARKWLIDDDLIQAFSAEIAESRTLVKLLRVPLLATLVLAVFKKRKSLPSSKIVLYETFIDLLCGGWDYVKSVNRDSKYGRHEKIAILSRFAGILHLNRQRQGSEAVLRKAVSDVAPLRSPDFDLLLNEIIEDGLIQRSAGQLIFGHLSFQEFLAARELGDPSGERNNVVLLDFLRGDDWWREVLAFYVAGPNRPDEMERWLRKAAEKVEMSGIASRPRERFLLGCIEEACPGWTPKLLQQSIESVRSRS